MATKKTLFIGIGQAVVSMDTAGVQKWRTGLPTAVDSLIVEGNRLYVSSGGAVSCLKADDGQIVWRQDFGQGRIIFAG